MARTLFPDACCAVAVSVGAQDTRNTEHRAPWGLGRDKGRVHRHHQEGLLEKLVVRWRGWGPGGL